MSMNKKPPVQHQRTDVIKCEERRRKMTIEQIDAYWDRQFRKMTKEANRASNKSRW
jgi:hypothetical protein